MSVESDLVTQDEAMVAEIKSSAADFAGNKSLGRDFFGKTEALRQWYIMLIESAMMIGAGIALRRKMENE